MRKMSMPWKKGGLRLFDNDGREVAPGGMAEVLARADVALFGELHGIPAVHALELEIARTLLEVRKGDLLLGAEMFEADNQIILDEYLAGLILHRHLVAEAKVWDRYETDYRPLVELARVEGLRFIATNIPRRYANLVAREGVGALMRVSDEGRRYMAPLPVSVDLSTPGYREMLRMSTGHNAPMSPGNFVAAQAVKDAAMAHFILTSRRPGTLFLHFNGVYHSQRRGGIYWYLKKGRGESLHILTVSSVTAGTLEFREEYRELGDFVAVVSGG